MKYASIPLGRNDRGPVSGGTAPEKFSDCEMGTGSHGDQQRNAELREKKPMGGCSETSREGLQLNCGAGRANETVTTAATACMSCKDAR